MSTHLFYVRRTVKLFPQSIMPHFTSFLSENATTNINQAPKIKSVYIVRNLHPTAEHYWLCRAWSNHSRMSWTLQSSTHPFLRSVSSSQLFFAALSTNAWIKPHDVQKKKKKKVKYLEESASTCVSVCVLNADCRPTTEGGNNSNSSRYAYQYQSVISDKSPTISIIACSWIATREFWKAIFSFLQTDSTSGR